MLYEIKPIEKIQTKFNLFRKQNTHKSNSSSRKKIKEQKNESPSINLRVCRQK